MSTTATSKPDPALPRSRTAGGHSEPSSSRLQRIGRSRLFRPTLVGLTALAVGALLAPEWVSRNYPTDPALIGTPATGDIKAQYDDRGDIIDAATTARLRDEAVAKVPRRYDFDARLGDKSAETVFRAFEAARANLLPELDALGNKQRNHLPPAREQQAAATAVLKATLDIALSPEDAQLWFKSGYPATAATLLGKVLHDVQNEPIVEDAASLQADSKAGIIVRRVPEQGQAKQHIRDVDTVQTLERARAAVPKLIDSALDSIGQQAARDAQQGDVGKQAAAEAALLATLRGPMVRLATQLVAPTLTFNRRDTEMARVDTRLGVNPVSITVKRGEMIIRDGEVFNEQHLLILTHMAQYSRQSAILMVSLGGAMLLLILILVAFSFSRSPGRGMLTQPRDPLMLSVLFVAAMITARLWVIIALAMHEVFPGLPLEAMLFMLPVAGGAMISRLVLRVEIALLFAVAGSVVLGLMVEFERLFAIYALVGAALGATVIRSITARGDLLRAGVWVGLGQAATAIGIHLFSAQESISVYLVSVPAAFIGGVLSAFVALALTPVVEAVFGYTTDLKLLELANLNHPALKELIVQAPGTYHHSIIVGSLVEAAAEAIHANPLLARVMAYYHDLGKGCNALYFIENQRGGTNPHDKLKPSMSAMIIRRHVTDGLEIAQRFKLGEQILAGIGEHHGTTLIQYFYARAKEQEEEETDPVRESDYRYPGRKPQSREAALVMLGDSVEAAARSLPDPNPARLQGLVNKIINVKFTDGQLEECDITLKDLHKIAKAFIRVLTSIYHQRVEYPELSSRTEKKQNGDSGAKPKSKEQAATDDAEAAEDRPDNIRRLGL